MTPSPLQFLSLLDPSEGALFNIETYSDAATNGTRPEPEPLPRRFPGKSLDHVECLFPTRVSLKEVGVGCPVTSQSRRSMPCTASNPLRLAPAQQNKSREPDSRLRRKRSARSAGSAAHQPHNRR